MILFTWCCMKLKGLKGLTSYYNKMIRKYFSIVSRSLIIAVCDVDVMCLSVHLPIYMPVFLAGCLPPYLSMIKIVLSHLSVSLYIFLSSYLSVCIQNDFYLPVCLSIYLSVCLPIYRSVCLCLFVCLCLLLLLSFYLSRMLNRYCISKSSVPAALLVKVLEPVRAWTHLTKVSKITTVFTRKLHTSV